MKNFLILPLIALLTVSIFSSCNKEDDALVMKNYSFMVNETIYNGIGDTGISSGIKEDNITYIRVDDGDFTFNLNIFTDSLIDGKEFTFRNDNLSVHSYIEVSGLSTKSVSGTIQIKIKTDTLGVDYYRAIKILGDAIYKSDDGKISNIVNGRVKF
ncbi:MAG: hypothetical protein KAH32_08330 [Chlamydiia bacterium]|nr:hypothetical protein [Chlamydiia bacterium]